MGWINGAAIRTGNWSKGIGHAWGPLRFPSRNQYLRGGTAQHESFWAKVVTVDSGIFAVQSGLKVTRNRTEGKEFLPREGLGFQFNGLGRAGFPVWGAWRQSQALGAR